MTDGPEDLPPTLSLAATVGDEPLADAVYRTVRDAICDGRLGAGRKLAQVPLANHLGVSRTPVRDALQRLSQEGLVRAPSWRGFIVSEFSVREVLDIYELRLALEPLAVGQILDGTGYTRTQLATLHDVSDETIDTSPDDLDRLYDLNRDFHMGLVSPCSNPLLIRFLGQLWQVPASLRLFHAQASASEALKQSGAEHHHIIAAIESGDRELALERVRQHILAAQQETLEALEQSAS